MVWKAEVEAVLALGVGQGQVVLRQSALVLANVSVVRGDAGPEDAQGKQDRDGGEAEQKAAQGACLLEEEQGATGGGHGAPAAVVLLRAGAAGLAGEQLVVLFGVAAGGRRRFEYSAGSGAPVFHHRSVVVVVVAWRVAVQYSVTTRAPIRGSGLYRLPMAELGKVCRAHRLLYPNTDYRCSEMSVASSIS